MVLKLAKIRFYLLDIDYKEADGKAAVYMYGRTHEGQRVCIVDDSFEPYFYAVPKDSGDAAIARLSEQIKKIKAEKGENDFFATKVERVAKKQTEQERQVLKVFVNLPAGVPLVRSQILEELDGIEATYEYDIRFARRYLIDKGLTPLTLLEAEVESIADAGAGERLRVPKLKASHIKQFSEDTLKPRMLAFDIETYNPTGTRLIPEEHPIVMISFYSENFRKVITWKQFDRKKENDFIEFAKSELEMLERFKQVVEEFAPDLLIGYYSDGFDLPYIKTRADKYNLDLDFGLDRSELKIAGRDEKIAEITGFAHIDILKYIRKVAGKSAGGLKTDILTLDAVSKEVLGESKHEVDIEHLARAWDDVDAEKLNAFCEYNLNDSRLAFLLCGAMLPNITEMVKIISLPIADVNRMSFSQLVEWFAIKQARAANELVPNKPGYREQQYRAMTSIKGAFVFEPTPGLYKEMVVLDYRSLYPTIIASHNISLGTLDCSCCEGSAKAIVPLQANDASDIRQKHWFCTKKKGFISSIIEDLIARRARIKEIMRAELARKGSADTLLDARSYALKVLANAFYGYLGFAPARWYCLECAESTTAWGRHYIKNVIESSQKEGFKVLYADSLTNERFVTILDPEGILQIQNIEELFERHAKESIRRGEKEVIRLEGYKALTINPTTKQSEWKKIAEIIRHKANKKIFRISQKYGETRVTEDHSIVIERNGGLDVAKPKEMLEKHFVRVKNIPQVKEINSIDIYEYLKDISYCTHYKGRKKVIAAHADGSHVWFNWTTQQKPVKIKRFMRIGTEEFECFCRLLGAYIPEGSSSTPETTTSRWGASIASSDVNWLRQLKSDYEMLFENASACVIPSTKKTRDLSYKVKDEKHFVRYRDTTHKLQMMNKLAAIIFKAFCGQKSTGKKIPSFAFHIPRQYQGLMLNEIIKGDGSHSVNKKLGYSEKYIERNFRYTTKSLQLICGLSFLLTQLGRNYYIHYRPLKQTYSLGTSEKSNRAVKTKLFQEEYGGYVYDLAVDGNHMFVDSCGQILLHNTDSAFLLLGEKTKTDAERFVEKINKELPGLMELEVEGFYPAGIFVGAKAGAGETGAKKKYAIISEQGNLKIRGFETVRRNWSFIAKDAQLEVLKIILKEHNPQKAISYIKQVICDLRHNRIPLDKVIIFTKLQKEIEQYDSVGPHVAAAQRMKAKGLDVGPGSLIKFVVVRGKGKIRDKVKLPEETNQDDYDADYYINNQIIPSVERIFGVLGFDIIALTESESQQGLGQFLG